MDKLTDDKLAGDLADDKLVGGTLVAQFSRAMDRLGPFEPQPELAVAVSGGADSLTLALLADRWARAMGGRITALTVDHGLRAESAAEAKRVGRWLKAAGIRHRILRWSPPRAHTASARATATKSTRTKTARTKSSMGAKARLPNLQAAAREARYDLLCAWCRDHHVLHLLLAHHRDDQAETLMLRLARGSGLDGLAAMAPLAERATVRLLRPLLAVSKTELSNFLVARGQAWVEDPSNRDSANARVRMRALLPRLADEGLTVARLAATAERLAQARVALEGAVTALLSESVALYPEGYLCLDATRLTAADREIGLRALARSIACIGGTTYGPRLERLTRLYESLCIFADAKADGSRTPAAIGRGVTLGGCRIVPVAWANHGDARRHIVILREAAAMAPPLRLSSVTGTLGAGTLWDGRFLVTLTPKARKRGEDRLPSSARWSVGALGEEGWRQVKDDKAKYGKARLAAAASEYDSAIHPQAVTDRGLPRMVLMTLPVLRQGRVLIAVPHLGYRRMTPHLSEETAFANWEVRFMPLSPLTRPGFTLV